MQQLEIAAPSQILNILSFRRCWWQYNCWQPFAL